MSKTNAPIKKKKETYELVIDKIHELESCGGLNLPQNYSAENSIRSAWLVLKEVKDRGGKPALEVCSKESVANALLEMVVKGLNPLKSQCYFIPYGDKLVLQESYQGKITRAKRIGLKSIFARVIYKDDEFEQIIKEDGSVGVHIHKQPFKNIGTAIIGAYCTIITDNYTHTEVMNIDQITKAWNMGATKGNSPAHKNFDDQMCKKTVINRALKTFLNSSDDEELFKESNAKDFVKKEIKENANKDEVYFEEVEEVEEVENFDTKQNVKSSGQKDKETEIKLEPEEAPEF